MMTEYTVLPNWQEDELPQYRRTRAIREMTTGCPCDGCDQFNACRQSGRECFRFKEWVQGN